MANRFPTVLRSSGARILIKGAITVCALVAIGIAIKSLDVEAFFKTFHFSNSVDAGWFHGRIAFLCVAGVLAAIGCPRQAISFFAAYFFGLVNGFLLALAATVIGCVIAYSTARSFRTFFADFVKGKLNVALQFWKDNTLLSTMLFRFMPIGSNFITNLAAGAFGISAGRFFLGSAIGYVPQTAVFAIMGSGVEVGSGIQILISVILFALSALMGLMLYARFRKQMGDNPQDLS